MGCRRRYGCRNKCFVGCGVLASGPEGGYANGGSSFLEKSKARGGNASEKARGAGYHVDRAAEKGTGRDCHGEEFTTVRERRGDEIMNRRVFTNLLLAGTLAGAAGPLWAQEGPPPPPGGAVVVHGGEPGVFMQMGEGIELLGFEGLHGGQVVTGAPFSAVAVQETKQTLADGNHISRKSQVNLFRDSQGRFRKEVTLSGFGPLAASGQTKSFVVINDPVANESFVLHPETKAAEKMGRPFRGMKGPTKGAIKEKMAAREQEEIASGNLKKEDLGTQTIAGVSAQGTRLTRTIPAGQIGNEKVIIIVRETWFSNDLQMVVMSKRTNPWSGESTYTLTNIQRTEPAASLFAVPSDYTVTAGKNRMFIQKFKGGPGAPPPPPADN